MIIPIPQPSSVRRQDDACSNSTHAYFVSTDYSNESDYAIDH